MKPIRATHNILLAFAAMMHDPTGQHYALELSRASGVNIGTIYALLARLEHHGLVTSAIEEIDSAAAGRPPRRYYTFTSEGRMFAAQELRQAQQVFSSRGVAHA